MLLLPAVCPSGAQQYHVRHYTVDDGLPSSHVRDFNQDAQGRIWFATRSGIAVYDGLQWTTYNLADGLTWADQFALRWDAHGVLWSVGTISPFKVFYLDQNRWNEVPGPADLGPDLRITAFAALGEGTLAIGTDKRGVLLRHGGTWRTLGAATGLQSDRVTAIVARGDELIVGTPLGLAAIRDGVLDPAPGDALPPGSRDVECLTLETLPDGSDRLWVLGGDWIGHLEARRFALLVRGLAISQSLGAGLRVARADRRGGLYFGSQAALHYYHPDDGLELIGRDNGLLSDGVTALFLDREDNLWIGGERGVSKLISRRFARYGRQYGLLDDEVTAVLERSNGDIVLGHRGGLSILRGVEVRTVSLSSLAEPGHRAAPPRPERISDLAEDRRGNLWLAVGTLGLARIDAAGRSTWFADAEGLRGSVTSVLADSADRLWTATEVGLFLLRGGRFESPAGAPRIRVRRLFETAGGELVLTTSSGLHRFDGQRWQAWTCAEATSCNSVFAMLETADGSLWVGTSAGLHQTTADAMVRPAAPAPEIRRPIYFIVADAAGGTWFGTDDGVLRWDGEKLDHFTVEDGLAGRETHRAAGLVDSRGDVWIGTERGVSRYREPRPGAPRGPPIVSLTGVDVSGRDLSLMRPQRLAHDEDDLIFRFRAVSLLDEDRILISSRLEGYEDEWLEPYRSSNQEIRYTNLAPGEYVFHLRAANAEGTWSEAVSSAPLVIARPFWRRTWFFFAIAGASLATIYFVMSHLAQRKYSQRLEVVVEERVAQLLTEKERLALTLRNIDDGVITTDPAGEIVLLNPTAEEVTGWSNADAIGRPLGDVLRLYETASPGDPATSSSPGERGKPLEPPGPERPDAFDQTRSVVLIKRNGDRRLVELSGSPILRPGGGHTGLVLAFRDVTEKQKIDSELAKGQKLEALGLLAGGIAHDFNNLLTVLLGNLSLLRRSSDRKDAEAKYIADAENAVRRARDLTQQLLTFSRGGAPVRKAASISEVIRDSSSFVLSGSKVRCEIDLASDLRVVDIDSGQISQVFHNLLINAIQAMPGGGTVRICGRNTGTPPPSLPAGVFVAIDVIDHGIGIPKNHLGRIFDPYFSTKETGRGLGLASAYSIAKQHDGLLSVRSTQGEGTVFTLYLPASGDPIAAPPTADAVPITGSGRILVMDDDDAVRHVSGSILEQLGFDVGYAAEGSEAIERYRRSAADGRPFDAVIMDLTIPGGMGGQEAIGRLLDLDPAARAIVMSGYSNDPVLANYREHGFLGRLSKPFAAGDLARVLSEVLTTTAAAVSHPPQTTVSVHGTAAESSSDNPKENLG